MSWFHILTPVSLDENVWLFCWKIMVTTPVPEIKKLHACYTVYDPVGLP